MGTIVEKNVSVMETLSDMIMSRIINMGISSVSPNDTFGGTYHFDPYDFIEFVVDCEDEFKINMDSLTKNAFDGSFNNMTLNEMCSFIESLKKNE